LKERGIKGKQPQKTWDRLREFTRRLEMKRRASIPKQGLSDSGHDYYRLIMENSLFIITILNGDGKVMYNSPSIRGVLGYEPGELKGKSFFRLVHPHDLPAFNKNFESGLKTSGAMEYVEYRLQHKDGSWRFLESIGNNLLDDREVRGIVVSSRDVTDHRLAESRLRESEVMYKALVQASPHAVTMADLEGNITFVSPQTLELHGYGSEDELIGTSAFVLIAPEDHQKAAVNLSRTLTEGLVANIYFVFLRKDGSRFIAELNAALIRDSMGRPSSFVAFTRDITARKRMEKELRDRNDELEAFAYTISHDLLTPAAIVEGYAKAALEADSEGRPEAERECLESIMRGARRMSDLIDCLLQYAQAGHMETELELVEPRDILQ
jgi:PAS domain S-box-containing protein